MAKTKTPVVIERGWVWMTHPSRNGGKPFPVRLFMVDGSLCYQPFDFDATDFDHSLMDEDWAKWPSHAGVPETQSVRSALDFALDQLVGWVHWKCPAKFKAEHLAKIAELRAVTHG